MATTLPTGALAPGQTEQVGSKAAVTLLDSLLSTPSLPQGTSITPQAQSVQANELLSTPGVTGTLAAQAGTAAAPTAIGAAAPTTTAVGALTPQTAAGYTYQAMTSSANTGRWSFASGTGSSYTGAAGGINSSTTSFPVGDAQIAQVGASYYAYRECSGATRWASVFMRSPSFTIASGDKLRVVHALTGPTSQSGSIDPDDSLWIGVY